MNNKWYKDSIIYQIYPRSFADSNGDGIGDLGGVIEHIDHLVELGVDAVWFSPLYASPNHDYGYDISDYTAIHPEFGTMEQFDKMVELLHSNNIRVIMDLVINHTSSQHKWFIESRKSVDNPYRDYYYWAEGKGKSGKKPPNNWTGFFLGSAWQYDETTQQHYLHLFDKEQPDLNYTNPKVIKEIQDILRFWLDKGVDGFRCDVITLLDKTEGLPNGKKSIALTGKEHFIDGARMEYLLTQLQQVLSEYDAFTVGESVFIDVKTALRYASEDNTLLDTLFAFDHMGADSRFGIKQLVTKFRLRHLKQCLTTWQNGLYNKGWNALYFENHDQARIVGRYCDDRQYRIEGAKLMATLLMTLSGTPFVYQGQEIGMTSIRMPNIATYKDVESIRSYKLLSKMFGKKGAMRRISYCSRDNARTPMQWSDQPNAGFTTGTSWLSINPNYHTVNVQSDKNYHNGVFQYYQQLISLRKQHAVFRYGTYSDIAQKNKKVLCYIREYQDEKLLVILNFATKDVNFRLPAPARGNWELIISNYNDSMPSPDVSVLRPHEAMVYKLVK